MERTIRQNAWVVFDEENCPKDVYEEYYKPIFGGKMFIFLGEVPQTPGHCILADLSTGKILGMYHTDDFREAREDETSISFTLELGEDDIERPEK